MNRRVIWARPASRDLETIFKYIAENNPRAAMRVTASLRAAGDGLGIHSTGRKGRDPSFYEKTVAGLPYVIAYAIRGTDGGEEIHILRVVHTARDWPPGGWPKA